MILTITIARKRMIGTVAGNVLAYGVGGLNVDGCRVGQQLRPVMVRTLTTVAANCMSGVSTGATPSGDMTNQGRWPANLILTRNPRILENFPITSNGGQNATSRTGKVKGGVTWGLGTNRKPTSFAGDSGSAARFFKQVKED